MGLLQGPADMKYLLALTLVYPVLAQDTYHCPDGWVLEEDRSGCRCFMFSGEEMVTKDDADVLCQAHDAWVAELDHPGINYWLKSQLLNKFEQGDRTQFWMGAYTGELHSGLTGPMASLTTTMDNTAWAWWRSMTPGSSTETTSGTMLTVRIPITTSVRRLVLSSNYHININKVLHFE